MVPLNMKEGCQCIPKVHKINWGDQEQFFRTFYANNDGKFCIEFHIFYVTLYIGEG